MTIDHDGGSQSPNRMLYSDAICHVSTYVCLFISGRRCIAMILREYVVN